MASGRLHPFSPRSRIPPRLDLAFRLVRRFVSTAKPSLAWVKLRINCPEIVRFRTYNPGKVGQRSFMHTFHSPSTVCSLSLVGTMAEGYLIGLMLHEFGHLGSGGGEREADRWILKNFGIRITYVGELDLEWVDQWAIRKILRASTPPRENHPRKPLRPGRRRNPHHRCPLPRRPQGVPSDPLP